jgi:F-type H+-transporting ATPase subunit a
MEHHNSWITELLNRWLGGYVLALYESLGIHPHDPAAPIPEVFVMTLIVVLLLMGFTLWLKSRLSVESPGGVQQVVEGILTNKIRFGIRDLLDDNVGHGGRQYLAMVGTIGLFVLVANSISVLPAFTAPTINPSVPLACALITFCYFNYQGMRRHGVGGYLKHFAGPVWWMSWLIFPVEVMSTTVRILSLTVRLWANIFASELIYFIILGMFVGPVNTLAAKGSYLLAGVVGIFAAALPVAFVGLHLFVAIVQAFVFTILPSVYLGLAVAEEH